MAKAKATTEATEKKRRGLSPESRLKLALNDVLSLVSDNKELAGSPEVTQASTLLSSLGFETRPSAAKRIAELQTELQAIDITQSDAQTRINELSREIGKLRKV